jgi:hypothetical protein
MNTADSARDDSWSGQWVLNKIRTHDEVSEATLLSPKLILITRNRGDHAKIATMAVDPVCPKYLIELLKGGDDIDFVVNIPKAAYVIGEVFDIAEARNVAFGGFGDLMGALACDRVRDYVNKEFGFVLRGLRQHSKVTAITRLDDRRLRIERQTLPPVTVLVLNEYEFAADHVRHGVDRYGEFQAILRSNPNSRVTTPAEVAADELGIRIFSWGELLSELNRNWTWKKLPLP